MELLNSTLPAEQAESPRVRLDEMWLDVVDEYKRQLDPPLDPHIYDQLNTLTKQFFDKQARDPEGPASPTDDELDPIFTFFSTESDEFQKDRKGGRLARIRSSFSSFMENMAPITKTVGDVAASAFAPASIIAAAVTHAMSAVIAVSKNLDLVEALLSTMTMFCQRLGLLGDKMPREDRFRSILMEVLRSMLVFCTTTRRRALSKRSRAVQFGRAMLQGDNPIIQNACHEVLVQIQHLDAAVVMQTLHTAGNIEEKLGGLGTAICDMQEVLARDNLIRRQEMFEAQQRHRDWAEKMEMNEKLAGIRSEKRKEFEIEVLGLLYTITGASGQPTEKKPRALHLVTHFLTTGAESHIVQTSMGAKGMIATSKGLQWVAQDETYAKIGTDGATQLLHVLGKPGLGKTFVACSVYWMLRERPENPCSVAYFRFNRTVEVLQSLNNMLACCLSQIAQEDVDRYRRDIRPLIPDTKENMADHLWHKVYKVIYSKNNARHLVLVLDDVDQLADGDLWKLRGFISEAMDTNIHFVVTTSQELHSRAGGEGGDQFVAGQETLALTDATLREKQDFQHAVYLLITLPTYWAVQRLPRHVKESIATSINRRADSKCRPGEAPFWFPSRCLCLTAC